MMPDREAISSPKSYSPLSLRASDSARIIATKSATLRAMVRCTGSVTGSATSASTAYDIETPRSAAIAAIRCTVVSPMPRAG